MSDKLLSQIVSRETYEHLHAFAELIHKWNPRINLISRATLSDLWSRHILDSYQLWEQSDNSSKWVDLGSGGGFPGIVIACLQAHHNKSGETVLIESDKRKCAFLHTVISELRLPAQVIAGRIEQVTNQQATILSARALAPLDQLLHYAQLHLPQTGTALFPKGENWQKEVHIAKDKWCFDCDVIQSKTDVGAAILKIKNIKRR